MRCASFLKNSLRPALGCRRPPPTARRRCCRPSGYQIYNLGNGDPIPLKAFIGLVEASCGKAAIIDLQPPQARPKGHPECDH